MMIKIKTYLFSECSFCLNLGLLMIRVIPGYFLFNEHGLSKITTPAKWEWLGQAAMSTIGVEFGYVFFGFLAAFSEGICSLLVLGGFLTRPAAMMVIFTMMFAGFFHLGKGESPESAFIYMAIYLMILLTGPGKYSFDQKWFGHK